MSEHLYHDLDDVLRFDSHGLDAGHLDTFLGDHFHSPWDHEGHHLFGTPTSDADLHSTQSTPFTCAVVAQQMILRSFGIDMSEAQLVYDATSHGWLTELGTHPTDMAKLLDFYGVKTHMAYGDVGDLLTELIRGHKVIVSLDSGELWGKDSFFEDLRDPAGEDHAVMVTGLDLSDPAHPRVVVNDPGDPAAGRGHSYPLDQFLDAWADSGNFYVATDAAPLNLESHPIIGLRFAAETGMYMNEQFWKDWMATEFARHHTLATEHLFTGHGPAVEQPISALEALSNDDRNRLFTLL